MTTPFTISKPKRVTKAEKEIQQFNLNAQRIGSLLVVLNTCIKQEGLGTPHYAVDIEDYREEIQHKIMQLVREL